MTRTLLAAMRAYYQQQIELLPTKKLATEDKVHLCKACVIELAGVPELAELLGAYQAMLEALHGLWSVECDAGGGAGQEPELDRHGLYARSSRFRLPMMWANVMPGAS